MINYVITSSPVFCADGVSESAAAADRGLADAPGGVQVVGRRGGGGGHPGGLHQVPGRGGRGQAVVAAGGGHGIVSTDSGRQV